MGGFSINMGGSFGEYATVVQVQLAVQCLVRRTLWDTRFASLSLDFSGTFSSQGTEHRQRERPHGRPAQFANLCKPEPNSSKQHDTDRASHTLL